MLLTSPELINDQLPNRMIYFNCFNKFTQPSILVVILITLAHISVYNVFRIGRHERLILGN